MIKHIVFFKFMDGKKESDAKELVSRLETLPSKIEYIRSYEVGIDVLEASNSYDVALVSSFNSIEDLMKYKEHPAHLEFAEYMRTVCDNTRAVDFSY